MEYHPSLTVSYLLGLLENLEYEDSFYKQVRAVQALASILYELGDKDAKPIIEEAVKYEPEAYLLDLWIREIREELTNGNAIDFSEDLKQRMVRLRYALERFKARLVVSLDEKLKGKVPLIIAKPGEK